jgi:TM2 domain-containing membrane protein YozV
MTQTPDGPYPQQPVERYPAQPYQQPYPPQQPNLPYPPPQPNLPYPVQQGAYMQPYGGMAVAPKNPGLALLASFFIPGLGSLINGSIGLGIVIFMAFIVACVSITFLIGLLLVPAVWVWGMIDAYQGAKKWNRMHGILS